MDSARLPWDAADPYPFYESRRLAGNVVWDDIAQAWLVLGYDAARQVLGGSGWTSNPMANPVARASMAMMGPEFTKASMLFTDDADHDRLRGAVRDAFTRSTVAGLTEGVETIAAEVVAAAPTGEPFDFMSQIALPLPIAVVGEWLNLDPAQAASLRELSPAIIRMLGTLADPVEVAEGFGAAAALMAEFLPLAADRRAHPGDDLFSFIATAPELSLEDVVVTAILIAVAGHETTANLLGAGLIRLLDEQVAAVDGAVVTELLRLDGPVQSTVRTATEDQPLGIAAGDSVIVVVAAANRDPAVFDEPDRFRLGRTGPAPLAFGYGAHFCLGSALAQLELTVALRKIFARQPLIVGDVTWRDTPAIRGPQTLPVVFKADD
ncbi:cytochrome P450 [Mycobacterium sp. CBMA293]|uniref:cytochrome P450 n=1 Tax=unclassified Mycolicibacterium TaxID=2636767 RepID=UPI0012DBF297|nr:MULTISPECIES: cytochrome P450 [unclassified Mycolicibacterium]MUL46112.1 cytochrome P450 [Mycolicibacterium sp. CBMA 360]MUL58839.1 cytochrome P450 [Mycolicibacterium sp. CBMA 335]MUL69233.1 cytochrome P450 [Mycolicibacterium sp. CBMA 311]MUL94197.1 cytochrome P450 [Mycolicibacterium sp. CBMA 230]MUM05212.1 cytochrome [Mycolicibacterium sp. CBMA 213]